MTMKIILLRCDYLFVWIQVVRHCRRWGGPRCPHKKKKIIYISPNPIHTPAPGIRNPGLETPQDPQILR